MSWISKLLGRQEPTPNKPDEQCILIELDGTSLPDSVYEECDLATLDDLLTEAMAGLGEYDGHESGLTSTTAFLYGPNAEIMFKAIEPVLNTYPLVSGATVTIRQGPPGSPQRIVEIAKHSPA